MLIINYFLSEGEFSQISSFINGEKGGLGTFQQLNLEIKPWYSLSCFQ